MWSDNIKNSQIKFDTVCFGGEDWWYHNRGHIDMQLMRRFAKKGTALYVNSIVMQKLKLSIRSSFMTRLIRKTGSIFKGLKKSEVGFWVYSPVSLPLHHMHMGRQFNTKLLMFQTRRVIRKLDIYNPVVWVGCPAACDVVLKMKKDKLVYQRTDCYEEYPNVDAGIVKEYDRKLKAEADLTIFVNDDLYNKESSQCKKAFYLDHGVDFEIFTAQQEQEDQPADIANIPKPIVGYFGALDGHKLDFGFIESIVSLLPEMSFVFVGKESSEISSLLDKKNVWMLGQKPYEQIPDYGKCFDVSIIPWRLNRWTEAANPIKFKEYLALGKPIVSTPAFTELQKYLDVVYQAETAQEFAQAVKKALAEDCPERVEARQKGVARDSWDSKAETVLSQLFS